MAVAEDAAMVLEQFVQEVANLPAEIAHLLEEIQAKDKIIQEHRTIIATRDASIQKFIKLNGSLTVNPKEETYTKNIMASYDKAQTLQDEKVALSEKAAVLLDRQVRRLDLKIRDLQTEGTMPTDPPLPSLLHPSSANLSSYAGTPLTGSSTPLSTIPPNAVPSTTIANSDILRLAQPPATGQRAGSPIVVNHGQASHRPMLGASHLSSSAPTTPAASGSLHQRARESSAGIANDAKRRRLNNLGGNNNLPTTSSGLARPSSLGPGTPKAGTPSATGSSTGRAGSAGPRAGLKKTTKKIAPHQQVRKALAGAAANHADKKGGLSLSKKANKRLTAAGGGLKGSPSSTTGDDDSVLSEPGSGSEEDERGGRSPAASTTHPSTNGTSSSSLQHHHNHGPHIRKISSSGAGDEMDLDNNPADADADPDPDDDENGDDRKYCTCRNVSFGNMVACDNDACPYEWFHWQCVGVTKEPIGKWFCEECRGRMGG